MKQLSATLTVIRIDGKAPSLRFMWAKGMSERRAMAEMHVIAAMCELASENEQWVLEAPQGAMHAGAGKLAAEMNIELMTGSGLEQMRAAKMFDDVVARLQRNGLALPA
jgi:hypothetical protein